MIDLCHTKKEKSSPDFTNFHLLCWSVKDAVNEKQVDHKTMISKVKQLSHIKL
jgi:hypothetical protein